MSASTYTSPPHLRLNFCVPTHNQKLIVVKKRVCILWHLQIYETIIVLSWVSCFALNILYCHHNGGRLRKISKDFLWYSKSFKMNFYAKSHASSLKNDHAMLNFVNFPNFEKKIRDHPKYFWGEGGGWSSSTSMQSLKLLEKCQGYGSKNGMPTRTLSSSIFTSWDLINYCSLHASQIIVEFLIVWPMLGLGIIIYIFSNFRAKIVAQLQFWVFLSQVGDSTIFRWIFHLPDLETHCN